MKKNIVLGLSLLCFVQTMTAQTEADSADVFYKHLEINEVTVTGLTGQSRMKEMPAPVSILTGRELQTIAATNIIDAIAHQPGVSQITTGSGISKPVIRGLGFNRVAVVSDGIRQEGQQWGDEHGVEVDAQAVGQVEILKGPASLMYGSDAMAGVLILHPHHVVPLGQMSANLSTEYQTNNGLFGYSANFAGNKCGLVWDGRWSQKMAHAYQNKRDGFVPGSQFCEQSARLMLGVNRDWGHAHVAASYFHLTPSMVEGERDELTGELCAEGEVKTYQKALPFQQVYHYKVVSDNALLLNRGQLKLLLGYQQNRRQEFEESPTEYGLYFMMHTLNYDLRYLLETQNGWKLAAGVVAMYQHSMNKGDEYLIPAYVLFDVGSFATASHRVGRWNLTGGVRMDHRQLNSHGQLAGIDTDDIMDNRDIPSEAIIFEEFSRHFNGFSASLGGVCNLTQGLDLRLNLSRGFRAPNMSELGSKGVHEGTMRYEVGNHDLDAEQSLQFDLGLNYSSRHVSAQLALFANRIENYIYIHRTGENLDDEHATFRYDAGDARLMGFEAMVDVHPVHSIHFENTFSLVDAVQLHQPRSSKYLPFTPAPRWTSELKYEITHNGHLLNNAYASVGLECYLKQDHYHMADDTETATPSYTLFNLTAGTDVCLRGRQVASLYLTASNLFDRVYQNHLSRLKYIGVNPVSGRMGISNMGRNVSLKLVVPISL